MINFFSKRLNKKGFTLAELLIVVAIIAILVAIAIPIFTNQLQKARIARDQANVRSARAVAINYLLDEPDDATEHATWQAFYDSYDDDDGWTFYVTFASDGTGTPTVTTSATAGATAGGDADAVAKDGAIVYGGAQYTLSVKSTDVN